MKSILTPLTVLLLMPLAALDAGPAADAQRLAAAAKPVPASAPTAKPSTPAPTAMLKPADSSLLSVVEKADRLVIMQRGAMIGEFGEQFADDIRLTLKTQPKLPVRVAQR